MPFSEKQLFESALPLFVLDPHTTHTTYSNPPTVAMMRTIQESTISSGYKRALPVDELESATLHLPKSILTKKASITSAIFISLRRGARGDRSNGVFTARLAKPSIALSNTRSAAFESLNICIILLVACRPGLAVGEDIST